MPETSDRDINEIEALYDALEPEFYKLLDTIFRQASNSEAEKFGTEDVWDGSLIFP